MSIDLECLQAINGDHADLGCLKSADKNHLSKIAPHYLLVEDVFPKLYPADSMFVFQCYVSQEVSSAMARVWIAQKEHTSLTRCRPSAMAVLEISLLQMEVFISAAVQVCLHLFLPYTKYRIKNYMIQICSGITSGRVLNGKLYAQRLHKLISLHLLTCCFMKISLQSSEQNSKFCSDD